MDFRKIYINIKLDLSEIVIMDFIIFFNYQSIISI